MSRGDRIVIDDPWADDWPIDVKAQTANFMEGLAAGGRLDGVAPVIILSSCHGQPTDRHRELLDRINGGCIPLNDGRVVIATLGQSGGQVIDALGDLPTHIRWEPQPDRRTRAAHAFPIVDLLHDPMQPRDLGRFNCRGDYVYPHGQGPIDVMRDEMRKLGRDDWQKLYLQRPALPPEPVQHVDIPPPPTKRQRRRLRGKGRV